MLIWIFLRKKADFRGFIFAFHGQHLVMEPGPTLVPFFYVHYSSVQYITYFRDTQEAYIFLRSNFGITRRNIKKKINCGSLDQPYSLEYILWSRRLPLKWSWPLFSSTFYFSSFFFFFFLSMSSGIFRKMKFCFISYFGITRRNINKKNYIVLQIKLIFVRFFLLFTDSVRLRKP